MKTNHVSHADNKQGTRPNSKVIFGFWLYLMTDAVMFCALFATYEVLKTHIFGALNIHDVTNLSRVFEQTIILTITTLTISMSTSFVKANNTRQGAFWLIITLILGLIFAKITYSSLADIVKSGYSWKDSAFLSAYFSLIGIQLVHIVVGLLWMLVIGVQLIIRTADCTFMKTRFVCLSLFWSYLNIIWLITFSIVYLMGSI